MLFSAALRRGLFRRVTHWDGYRVTHWDAMSTAIWLPAEHAISFTIQAAYRTK